MRKITSTFDTSLVVAIVAVFSIATSASYAETVQAQGQPSRPSTEEVIAAPVASKVWVPNDVGRSWTYVYFSERSRTSLGEVAEVETLKGMRTDAIVSLAPELGTDVFRLESTTVGRTAPDAPDSTERLTNFYRATGSTVELFAEQHLDPTTGTAPLVRYEVPLSLLEATAEPGQRWKVGVRSRGDLHTDLEGEVLGVQDVQTPLGAFENCLVIRLTGQTTGVVEVYGHRMEVPSGDYSVTQWYAPGVGLVLAKERRSRTLVHEDGSKIEYGERAQFALRSTEPGNAPVPAASE